MHDVLGHRLSLLSVHAGALEFRPDASPEEIARAAKVIRENAHLALQDLREVIGVLRAPWACCPSPPWPTPASSSPSRAGPGCGLACARSSTAPPFPTWWGRTAYRTVQRA
jgi:Histidine kinase